MLWISDNPVADATRRDWEEEQIQKILPKCVTCGEVIDEDYVYVDNDGPKCEDCFNKAYRIDMDEFLEL